jgi:ribosomal protein S17E
VQKYEWFSLSKVKKIAEDFLAKFPASFSADFEANKRSLDQLAVIRNRALRNQIAGAITKMIAGVEPEKTETDVELDDVVASPPPQATGSSSNEPVAQEA